MATKDIEYTVHDYGPLNKAIDENLRIKRTRSVWGYAKSVALILIALGIFLLLLAWAYSLLSRHYQLKQITTVQERVIEKETQKILDSKEFSKTVGNLESFSKTGDVIAKNEKLEKEAAKEKEKQEKLSSELAEIQMELEAAELNQIEMKKTLEEQFGSKINELKSENSDLLDQANDLQEKLQNNPKESELLQKIDELKKKGQAMGNVRYFAHKNTKKHGYDLTVKTRFHFQDAYKKPNKIECYINFGLPSLADLEMGTQNADFSVAKNYLEKGFEKRDFVNIKKNKCQWNYFDN